MSVRARILYRDGSVKVVTGRSEIDARRKLEMAGTPHIIGWESNGGDDYFRKLAAGWRGEGLNHSACNIHE